MKYPTVFHLIATEFAKARIPFLLVGGFAVNHYKVSRNTWDLDILIRESDFDGVAPILKGAGYQMEVRTELFARFRGNHPYFFNTDVIFADPKTFSGMLAEGQEIEMKDNRFIIPSLNHLIAMKLHAVKNNPRARAFKDLGDVIDLVRENNVDIRSDSFRNLCLKFASEEWYRMIMEYASDEKT